MIDRMSDRCRRICGAQQEKCYVNSKDQLDCIADMVINKTASISMALGFSIGLDDKEFVEENIRDSIKAANELSNWVRYLQLVGDLRTLSSLVLDSDSIEKRKEIRYPMPDNGLSSVMLVTTEAIQLPIVNFSQSGLQFASDVPVAAGAVSSYSLCRLRPVDECVSVDIEIMYSMPGPEGNFLVGARGKAVGGAKQFNIFSNVFQMLLEAGVLE